MQYYIILHKKYSHYNNTPDPKKLWSPKLKLEKHTQKCNRFPVQSEKEQYLFEKIKKVFIL